MHVSAPSGLKIQIAILFQPADGGIDGLLADVGQIADIPLQAAVAQKIKRIQNDGGAVGKPLPQCKIVVKIVQLFVKPVEFPYSGALSHMHASHIRFRTQCVYYSPISYLSQGSQAKRDKNSRRSYYFLRASGHFVPGRLRS